MIVINSSAYDEFLNKHSDDNPITPPTNFVEQGLENKDEVPFHPDQNKCDCSVLVNEKLDTKEKEGVEREIDYYYNDDVDNYEENEVNDYVPVVLIGHE